MINCAFYFFIVPLVKIITPFIRVIVPYVSNILFIYKSLVSYTLIHPSLNMNTI
jgi:hypothetical protein